MTYYRQRHIGTPINAITRLVVGVCAAMIVALGFSDVASARNSIIRLMPGAASHDFVLSCENGRDYLFWPRTINGLGDVVTGTLMTARHHGVHMRLIPMGDAYRYAGRGVWFDGYQDAARLNFGKRRSVACTVTGTTPEADASAVLSHSD